MTERPVYVGVGECGCARIDVRLYQVPGSPPSGRLLCDACLADKGFTVPAPRTAADIDMVDGLPAWKPIATVPTPEAFHTIENGSRYDLGHGHVFETVFGTDDLLVGWLHTHPDKHSEIGALCQSFCAVRQLNGAPVHQIISVDPLTLLPSLLCRTCGAHGNVTNGTWEPLP